MNKIEELRAMFGQAEEMKAAIDENTKEIAENLRWWCVNEAHRLEKLQNDTCDFISEHFDVLTTGILRSGFFCDSYSGCYSNYSNGTILFISQKEKDWSRKILDIGAKNDCKSHVGVCFSKLPKPSDRLGWNFDRIWHNANIGNSDIDFWTDAKLWLAIENERLNFFVDELKKVVKELVDIQRERFDRISKAHAEVMEKPKTVKVILEIHQ